MLYGISMVYGTTGTTYFADITTALAGTPLQVMAMVFFFAGLGFKLSLVPFHMWTPDTYQELRPMYRLTCQSSPKVQPLSL